MRNTFTMFLLIIAILITIQITGCQTVSQNSVAKATSQTLMDAAYEVDRAEKRGWITIQEEAEMLDALTAGQQLLKSAVAVGEVPGCIEGQSDQACLQQILLNIENKLRESKQ